MTAHSAPSLRNSGHFVASKDEGVQYLSNNKDTRIPVCSFLTVDAVTADPQKQNWGKLVSFSDPTGERKQHHILNASLMTNSRAVVSELVSQGLELPGHSRAPNLLIEYIRSVAPKARMISSPKPGWVGDSFLFTTGESFGPTRVLYSGDYIEPRHGVSGDWKDKIGRYCSGNSRFVFAASAAFAGPVLELVHIAEGGGFHLRGESSLGKSTALEIAASVYGNPDDVKRGWDGTKGSFESIAEAHNDQLLALDEIGMADEKTVGGLIYMLANGASRGRMKEVRRKWRVLSLSSGEITLAEQMAKAGATPMPGQETRLLDVPIEAVEGKMYRGVRLGAVEELHRFSNSKILTDHLKAATRKNYGVFGEYISLLVRRRAQSTKLAKKIVDQFVCEVTPSKSNGQIGRAVSRFAVVAAGGEIATSFDLTGWKKGEAVDAAHICFEAWHRYFQSYDPLSKAVGIVRQFIESNAERFQELGRGVAPVRELIGYRKKGVFLILPEIFRETVCAGLNHDEVAKSLETAGFLITSGSNRLMYSNRVTGNPVPQRFYAMRDTIISS